MKNISIKTKIMLAFSFLLLAIAAMGGVSIYSASELSDSVNDLGENYLPSVANTLKIDSQVGSIRRSKGQLLMATNQAQLDDTQKSVKKYEDMLAQTMKDYEALISTPEEKAAYEIFKKSMETYELASEKTFELLKNGDKELATENFLVDGRAKFFDVAKATSTLVKMNQDGADAAKKKAEKVSHQAIIFISSIVGLALLIAIIMGYTLIRSISVPITKISGVMNELADAKWDTTVPYQDHKDEIGLMSRSVNVFAKNGKEAEQMRNAAAKEQQVKEQRAKQMEAYISEFEQSVSTVTKGLAAASTEMQASARTMSTIAEQTTEQSGSVASAATQASSNVQTVASASEELSASISEISKQMSRAADVANHAVSQAEVTNEKMQTLSEAAQKISEVIQMINEIASQTNLLALNATIEAARAGEAGKGFAVVASEVKNLASETEKATEGISAQVSNMQEISRQAVSAIHEISETINQISSISVAVSSAVEEQGSATQEISRNVQEAARGTEEVTVNITAVTQAATETGSAAGEVLSAAEELAHMTNDLTNQVEKFLGRVRAA